MINSKVSAVFKVLLGVAFICVIVWVGWLIAVNMPTTTRVVIGGVEKYQDTYNDGRSVIRDIPVYTPSTSSGSSDSTGGWGSSSPSSSSGWSSPSTSSFGGWGDSSPSSSSGWSSPSTSSFGGWGDSGGSSFSSGGYSGGSSSSTSGGW